MEASADILDTILSDAEKAKMEVLAADDVMLSAVQKTLLASLYYNGTLRKDLPAEPLRNAALSLAIMAGNGQANVSNEDLGADLRATAEGVRLLEEGLKKIVSKFKMSSKPITKVKSGR